MTAITRGEKFGLESSLGNSKGGGGGGQITQHHCGQYKLQNPCEQSLLFMYGTQVFGLPREAMMGEEKILEVRTQEQYIICTNI